MSHRTRTIGLLGVLALLLLGLVGLALSPRGAQASMAVAAVPDPARESARAALAERGYAVASDLVWAGAENTWQAPGHYRLFFTAPEGNADLYSVDVQVDGEGRVSRLGRVAPLVQTVAGDESALVAADGWAAFATRVAGYYQSVTCLPLANPEAREVFAFGRPVEEVSLSWRSGASDGGPLLDVVAVQGGQESQASLDPVALQVAPAEADLEHMPVVRGEQAWLPNLVSRVRELPFVGPEKIAFLENVFFTAVDWVNRLTHGASMAELPQATATPSPTVPAELPPTIEPAGPEATTTVPAMPTAEPTVAPTPEGRHIADGVLWRGSVQPDPVRPYANVEVLEIDPTILQIKMVPGTIEPKPSTGLVGSGVIPKEDWPALVAAFNGGFAAMHGQFGMMVDRKVYLPARDGVATLAVYEDGSLRLGTWGEDLTQTPDMVSYRQNCPPLIKNGVITAETGKLTLWGLSVADEVYLYRSGLGVTRDGRLIYVCGRSLSAYTLARALQMAGAWYAMQLDVDEYHVAFITYDVEPGQDGGEPVVTGHKLLDNMHGFDGYFLSPFQLDFFYLVRRPQPLAQAVRMAPAAEAPADLAPVALDEPLPGTIAFAANRDGNWDVYTLVPGQPDSLQRLTDDPADDLYPAWSRDGLQLAFASRRDGNLEVYAMDIETRTLQRVTHLPSEEWAPCWSPDGQRLAYQSDRNGQSDIYVSALGESGETRLTPVTGNHEAPDWSPDGQTIVFDSDQADAGIVSATISLYLMNADGTNHRALLANAESPRWSPDGRMIAFTSRWSGRWQVYLLNADGSGLRQVTRAAWDARYPAWSPDGRWLAFAGNQDGHWELYAIPVAGGEPLRLTSGSGDSTYPTWGP